MDLAGNITTTPYTMSFDILPGTITMTTSQLNESLFINRPFADRFFVEGKNFIVDYEYINNSLVGYYLFKDEVTNHAVLHSYETAIRRNRARVKLEEQWFVQWNDCPMNINITCTPTQVGEVRVMPLVVSNPLQGSTIPAYNIFPQSIFSPYKDVLADTVLVNDLTSPTNTIVSEYRCNNPLPSPINFITDINDNLKIACQLVVDPFDPTIQRPQVLDAVNTLRINYQNNVEYQSDYPRNESKIFNFSTPNIPITNSIKVINDATATEISPING